MYKAVIFDLDGTLVNTINDIGCSVNTVLARKGLKTNDISFYTDMVGGGIRELIKASVEEEHRWNDDLVSEILVEYIEIYNQSYLKTSAPYQGIKELLDNLSSQNIKMSVLSNKTDQFTKKIVKEVFGDNLFCHVQGRIDGIKLKPAPDSALDIANKMGVDAAECVFVGDSEVDIKTAKNAKMLAVGVTWGYRSISVLERENADHIISEPKELLNRLSLKS